MVKIIGDNLPNIPWEDRPAGVKGVVWRSSKNPIIPRDLIPTSNSIFNSAVVPFEGKFAGVFRCDDTSRHQNIYAGFSDDGISWKLDENPIDFQFDDPEVGKSSCKYDPRVCKIDDRYYVMWCNGYHGPTIGLGYTHDFKTFTQMENAFLPCNRNGVLFPRKIDGNYVMLSRPSDKRHTDFGDIFLSESPDMVYWGKHRFVMGTDAGWQSTKIGPGPVPIETTEGWLMIYHGVLTSCNGFTYAMGAAILDIDRPNVVKYRTKPFILAPHVDYECVGDVPNVVFPCAALTDSETGRITIYYGAADSVVCMAHTTVDELVEFTKNNNL